MGPGPGPCFSQRSCLSLSAVTLWPQDPLTAASLSFPKFFCVPSSNCKEHLSAGLLVPGCWRLVSVGDHPWSGIGVQEVGPDSSSQEGQWPGRAVEVSVREWPLPPSFEHPHVLTGESHVYELAYWLTRIYNPQTAAIWEHAQGRKHFESLRSRSPAEVEGGDALPPCFNPTP